MTTNSEQTPTLDSTVKLLPKHYKEANHLLLGHFDFEEGLTDYKTAMIELLLGWISNPGPLEDDDRGRIAWKWEQMYNFLTKLQALDDMVCTEIEERRV